MSRKECTECKWWQWRDNGTSGWCASPRNDEDNEPCADFVKRDTSKPSTHSENTPENGANAERVNENEPKNIDTLKDMKIKEIIRYCKINPGFSMCAISDICRQNNCLLSKWPSADLDAAYELVKDKQPAETPFPMPGTATSATHYQLLQQQPIEIMQRLMTHEQFVGFLWGNVIKYALRLGHKDDTASDAGKLAQYSKWLMQAENEEEVKP